MNQAAFQLPVIVAALLAAIETAACGGANGQEPSSTSDAGALLDATGTGDSAIGLGPRGADSGATADGSGESTFDAAVPANDGGADAADANDSSTSTLPGVMMILMENHGLSTIIGDATDAPYINMLASSYASATAWSDVSHPSLPNYMALTGGTIFSNPNDCIPTWATATGDCTFDSTTSNLADQLTTAGIPWKAYMEDMPNACDTTDTFSPGNYDVNHNPFVYYSHVVQTPAECNSVVPYGQLATDLAIGTLPTFLWVTPNLVHDMHNGTIADGDAFLNGLIPQIQSSNWYRQGGRIILTWDESESGDQIPMLVVSQATSGYGAFDTSGNHYGTLRGIEELYGLPLLGFASDAANSGDLRPLL